MQIYINGELSNRDYKELEKEEILNVIIKDLDNQFIETIHLDNVEVNINYFQNNKIDLAKVEKIEIITKNIDELIDETLLEAKEYLPKLKQGLIDVANLFCQEKIEEGNYKYQLCLEGIEWYTLALDKILILIDYENLRKQVEEKLRNLNNIISKLMISYQKNDIESFTNIIEHKVINYIDDFIDINNKLLDIK